MPVPILLLSDSVDAHSGLARITRDLAVQLSALPEFRVGTMGRGGRGSSRLPWPQYVFPDNDWGQSYLPECWMDFAGNERGVLMTVYDPSRLRYLVDQRGLTDDLTQFLNSGRFERWAYLPVDASGPNGLLTGVLADTIKKLDRPLAYSLYAKDVIERSCGLRDIDWMPHGINFNAFQPRDKTGSRLSVGIANDAELIGMVATNQTRKDWGLMCVVASQLRKLRPGLRFWFHVDAMIRHWNLYALIQDYGLSDIVTVTTSGAMTDQELSWHYSACDLTVLPSSEGFGYPIAESLACGVPCIHSTYAGGAELVANKDWLVEPLTYRLDGIYNGLRPVWDPQDWVNAITGFFDRGRWTPDECRRSVAHLDWQNLGPVWQRWFKKGIGL